MKPRNLYKFLAFGILGLLMYSCFPEQEVAPIKDPSNNPLATITPQGDYSLVKEGDTLVFDITLDKMIKNNVAIDIDILDGTTLVEDEQFVIEGTNIPAYGLSTQAFVYVLSNDFPDDANLGKLELNVTSDNDITWNFQLNPATQSVMVNSEVQNFNDPDALTIYFEWDDPEEVIDFDLLIEYETGGESWSADGATGNNPEKDKTIRNDYDSPYDGTYLVGIDPFDVPSSVDIPFTVTIGHANGTVSEFSGIFNTDDIGNYTADTFSAWGSTMYRVLTVVKTGNSYDVTFEF